MTPRTTPEWHGKSPDAKVPDHVKLRIFRRHDGRCYLSGVKIRSGDAWDLDHIVALRDGGEHRESNLAPALQAKHRAKTSREAKERAYIDRLAKKHLGIKRRKGRPMAGTRASPWKQKLSGEWVRR